MGLNKDHIFQKFLSLSNARKPLVIAVSGGSDSLALLYLYAEFMAGHKAAATAHIATINHGLRPEAQQEAEFVAHISQQLSLPHTILHWQNNDPQSAVQEKARGARHQLLRDYAKKIGAETILLGHSLDDQSETYAMRKARSQSLRGLAAMAPSTLYCGDVWFARPLLLSTRHDLRDYLASQNQDWIDDPSNHDVRFERVRIRSQLQNSHEEERAKAEATRRQHNAAAAAFVSHYCVAPNQSAMAFHASANDILSAPEGLLAFRYALALMGDRAYLPNEAASQDALYRLRQGAITLSGSIVIEKDERIYVRPECRPGGMTAPQGSGGYGGFSIFETYLPSFDLDLANAFASLFGRNCFPVSPIG